MTQSPSAQQDGPRRATFLLSPLNQLPRNESIPDALAPHIDSMMNTPRSDDEQRDYRNGSHASMLRSGKVSFSATDRRQSTIEGDVVGSPLQPPPAEIDEDASPIEKLKFELSHLKYDLRVLEHEQRLSNEKALAAARRRLREKKRSEIARRLMEAQRLQSVIAKKVEEDEEKKKKVEQFSKEMTSLAQQHLMEASETQSRLFRVLGLRRLSGAKPAETPNSLNLLAETQPTPKSGQTSSRQPPSTSGRARTASPDGVQTLPPRFSESMLKQREWMQGQVAFALGQINERKAKAAAEERRRNTLLLQQQQQQLQQRKESKRDSNQSGNALQAQESLAQEHTAAMKELADVRRQLRELGVDTLESEQLSQKRKSDAAQEALLIREDVDYAKQRQEARVAAELRRLEEKEKEKARLESLLVIGERHATGDECLQNGVILQATSELNQRQARENAAVSRSALNRGSTAQSPGTRNLRVLSLPGEGRSPFQAALSASRMDDDLASNDSMGSTPRLEGTYTSKKGSMRGNGTFRPELGNEQQREADRIALLQAQQQERFVSQVRQQKEQLNTYRSKLEKLLALERELHPEPPASANESHPAGTESGSGSAVQNQPKEEFTGPLAQDNDDKESVTTCQSSRPNTEAAVAQEREVAALAIQRAFKVARCRTEVGERKASAAQRHFDVQLQEREVAAKTIQNALRVQSCKSETKQRKVEAQQRRESTILQEQDVATRTIQRAFKVKKCRDGIKQRREARAKVLQDEAAMTIQHFFLGLEARRKTSIQKQLLKQQWLSKKQEDAVVVIQSTWRMHKCRKSIDDKRRSNSPSA